MIWPLIIISYCSLFVFGITDNTRGPLFPEILKTFQVSDSKGALLFSFSAISGFLISLSSIYLLRRFDRKLLIEFACLFMSVSLFGLGFSPNFNWFIFFSVCFGIASSMLGLIPNILVPLGSTIEKRQQFISGLHAMYGISSLIAPLIVSLVYKIFDNWRACFYVCTIFPLILWIYSRKQDGALFNSNKREINSVKSVSSKNYKKLSIQLFLASALSFTVIGEVMMSSRLALFMRRAHGANLQESSMYVTYFFLAMLIGRTFFAIKKFRTSIPNQLTILGILTITFLFLGIKIHPFGFILAGLVVSPYYPLMASFIAEQFPKDLDQAMSLVVGIDSIMLALMHVFIGRITDFYGISNALLFGTFFISISVIFINVYRFKFMNQSSS